MRISPISRRRALAVVVAPAVAWIIQSSPAAAQQQDPDASWVPPVIYSESELDKLTPPGLQDPPPPPPAEKAAETPGGEKPVQLESKVSDETPVGEQPAKQTEEKKSDIGQPYVRKQAEREKVDRVKVERKAAERQKTDRASSDRTTVRR